MSEEPKKEQEQKPDDWVNPIDKDKITETPGTLPYAHTVGGAVIKPEDKGKIKGRAMSAMKQQTDKQIEQLRQQMQVLADQARDIQRRVEVSELIYSAQMGFEPLVGHTYYLYEKKDGEYVLSLVAQDQWGRSFPYERFVASATLLADHTWEVHKDEDAN